MKKYALGMLLGSSLFLLAACGSNEPTTGEKVGDSANANTEAKADEPKEEVQTEFAVGDVVDLDGTQVTITEVEKSQGGEYDSLPEGKEFVIAHVKIENKSDEQISYNVFDFQMKNSQGNITDTTYADGTMDTELGSGELAPNGMVEGTLTFEQSKDDESLAVIYTPNVWIDDKKITINLQ